MSNQLNPAFFLTFFLFGLLGCTKKATIPTIGLENHEQIIQEIAQKYAPDQRVQRFKVTAKATNPECPTLSGYTTSALAKRYLLGEFGHLNYCLVDSIRVLPDSKLGKDTFGIINVSVANLRTKAKHSGELTTQALLGMPIKVYDQEGDWFLVQTPDQYIAWLERGAFVRGDIAMMNAYYTAPLAYLDQATAAKLTDRPAGGSILRDISPGSILRTGEQTGAYRQIILPDGAIAYLADNAIRSLQHWENRGQTLALSQLAGQFYGQPYLWGGTSAKGMDCSGFTKMTYLMNGFVIPRDASQQVHVGTEVEIVTDNSAYDDVDLQNLQQGDLLFFGNLREDGSQRISHTGIYLGDGRFVHSGADNGFIREESLYRNSADYAAHRRASLLRAKRLSIGSSGVVPIKDIIDNYR